MLKWTFIVLAVLVGIPLIMTLIGLMLPIGHTASVSGVFRNRPQEVWDVVSDLEKVHTWQNGISATERAADLDGKPVWRHTAKWGDMSVQILESKEPTLIRTRIVSDDLPFGGGWTWRLEPEGDGCRLTVTEDGEVYNPFYRFMARFVFGYEGTLRDYMASLERRMASS